MSAKTVNEGRLGFLFVAFLYVFTLFIFIAPFEVNATETRFKLTTP